MHGGTSEKCETIRVLLYSTHRISEAACNGHCNWPLFSLQYFIFQNLLQRTCTHACTRSIKRILSKVDMRADWGVMRLLLFFFARRWMGNLVPTLGNVQSRTIFSFVSQQGTSQCCHGGWPRRVCKSMAGVHFIQPGFIAPKIAAISMLKKENSTEASFLRTNERTKLRFQCWKSDGAKHSMTFLRNALETFRPMDRTWRVPLRRAKMTRASRAGQFWIKNNRSHYFSIGPRK